MNPVLPSDQPAPNFMLGIITDFITDDEAEAILAAWDAQHPHLVDDDLADEPLDLYPTVDAITALHADDPIVAHERWQRRVATGDRYALEVAAAAERWQQEQDAQHELRRWRKEYKAALQRGDSGTASYYWSNIQAAKTTLRTARKV